MKKISSILLLLLASLGISSCEDVIDLEVKEGVEQLVVDGWLTNLPEDQYIKLTLSQSYFDNSEPKPALNATVTLADFLGNSLTLEDSLGDGRYWLTQEQNFLTIGQGYTLTIVYGGQTYKSVSAMNRVPPIDSIIYEEFTQPFGADSIPKEGFLVQVYAKDFEGEGDSYWVRYYRNGVLNNDPTLLTATYDAGFSAGSKTDGLVFIQPIRQSVNDFSKGPYQDGDRLKVQIWSTGLDGFFFLNQVASESGNGGIFATPSANIITNVANVNPDGLQPVGFFGISAVSEMEIVIDKNKALPPS